MERSIPSEIKRQLRQEAGFGCCKCGNPFYEYHHIVSFATITQHNAEDMMLLCPNHHREVTVGAIPIEHQYLWKKEPFNIKRGYVDGQLKMASNIIAINIGTNLLVGSGFKFIVDNEPILKIRTDKDGRILISLDLFNEKDDHLLKIIDNEWLAGDPLPWDFEFGVNLLKLRTRMGDIALFIDARSSVVSVTGTLWRKRQSFNINKEGLLFNGVVKDVGFMNLALIAMSFRADTNTSKFSFGPEPPFKEGCIVSWPDPNERLLKSIVAYRNLIDKLKIGRNDPCTCGSGDKWKNCCGKS